MYKYTFLLKSGAEDHLMGDRLVEVLQNYFQWRGYDIINGDDLVRIEIQDKDGEEDPYVVEDSLVREIITTLKSLN